MEKGLAHHKSHLQCCSDGAAGRKEDKADHSTAHLIFVVEDQLIGSIFQIFREALNLHSHSDQLPHHTSAGSRVGPHHSVCRTCFAFSSASSSCMR